MEFNIYMPARIICGSGCVLKNSAVFASFGKKALIVTGGSSAEKSGALSDVKAALAKEGIEYLHFDKISQNPLASVCIAGGSAAREFGADFVIGIGGGSSLDASKAVAICALNPEYDIKGLYGRSIPSKALPVVLVGTTSGTGSEVTGVSVLTNDETGMKKSISGADCYAAVSFLDYNYTSSMNRAVTVSTALDAFAHAAEGWFSKKCTPVIEGYARLALPVIFDGLTYLLNNNLPDEALREKLYLGSIYAGLVINTTGTAFPHTVGYILTENFGIPHGRACTAFMPCLLERAKKYEPEKLEELLKLLDTDYETLVNTVKALTDVKITADKAQLRQWCSRWGFVKNFDNSPGGFTNDDAYNAICELL